VLADAADLAETGTDATQTRGLRFEVHEGPGIDPTTILLTIAIGAASNLTADAAKAVWAKVLKRVRKKQGDDAVGPPADRGTM
ncbi:MAG: hypothetical protein LC808_26690, partial [Actinobacteria bacterium]|nr:hypothetical protein [Actinomycetota bacterium]